MIIVRSVGGVAVRVTHERLRHIYDRHPEMRGYEELIIQAVGNPEYVQEGDFGAKMGVRGVVGAWPAKHVVAV